MTSIRNGLSSPSDELSTVEAASVDLPHPIPRSSSTTDF